MSNSSTWRTAWRGPDIVVFQGDAEVDRVTASDIERVIFLYRGNGESAGDLVIWPTGGTLTWAWDRTIVTLPSGQNTIRLNPPLGPNIDHLNVIPLK